MSFLMFLFFSFKQKKKKKKMKQQKLEEAKNGFMNEADKRDCWHFASHRLVLCPPFRFPSIVVASLLRALTAVPELSNTPLDASLSKKRCRRLLAMSIELLW